MLVAELPPPAVEQKREFDAIPYAQQLDKLALKLAADREMMIVGIRDVGRALLRAAVQGGKVPDDQADVVDAELDRLQQERVAKIQGDTTVKISNLGPDVAGLYDGKDIKLRAESIDGTTYKHEAQHRQDWASGLPDDLDTAIAKKTGVAVIDKRLGIDEAVQRDLPVTKRDIGEERAMDAAEEIPPAYRETHWATVKGVEERGRAVGVDIEGASRDAVVMNDTKGLQKGLTRIAVSEIAEDNPDQLVQVAAEAREQGADAGVQEIIDETRERFEKGPESPQRNLYDAVPSVN